MTCPICGGPFEALLTSLPFKIGERCIVILKNLPVRQCHNCREYVIEDAVMAKIDAILKGVDATVELEVLSYAMWPSGAGGVDPPSTRIWPTAGRGGDERRQTVAPAAERRIMAMDGQ